MSTSKQLKEEQRVAAEQQVLILELQEIVKDIERCEKTIGTLRGELEGINAKHSGRQTTQDDIHYLEDLLSCAKRKLVWEKQIASLQKRVPALMQRVETLVNHPQSKPDEETRNALWQSLQNVKSAMDSLHASKL